jgi:hypothetical protein
MKRLLFILLFTCSILLSPDAPAQTSPAPGLQGGDALVPAAFGIRTDPAGNSWSIEADGNIGRIGNSMVNSGLALLVNEEKFTGFQPMMSPDGSEFVFQAIPFEGLPGLQVQRRVRVLGQSGGLRYAEMFYNGSTEEMNLTVALATNFSGNYKTFVSDRGRIEPVIMSKDESAIFVLPGSSQSSKAFLFTLGQGGNVMKPTISAQNRYGLTYRYQLRLRPQETGVIVHHVTQVVIPQAFDRISLLALSRPHSFPVIETSFDPDWKSYLVNVSTDATGTMSGALAIGGIGDLAVSPGVNDVLANGSQTRLSGKAEGEPLQLTGRYGEVRIPLEKIAAVTGSAGDPSRTPRLFLRDGQIFSGSITPGNLVFIQSSGSRLPLDPSTLDQLVMAKSESATSWRDDSQALIETYGGDRIAVRGPDALAFSFVTAWGTLPVTLNNLTWLKPASSGRPGHEVHLKDGSKVFGFIGDSEIAAGSTEIGSLSLNSSHLRSIFTSVGLAQEEGATVPAGTVIRLSGGQELSASLTNTTLAVFSGGSRLETSVNEVRRLRRKAEDSILPGGAAGFELERWDGGVVSGILDLDVISVSIAGRIWQIPIRDVELIETASPAITLEVQQKIEQLILSLASDDWNVRETATRELGALGYLAHPILRRELEVAQDPEVGRRIERVLSEMN